MGVEEEVVKKEEELLELGKEKDTLESSVRALTLLSSGEVTPDTVLASQVSSLQIQQGRFSVLKSQPYYAISVTKSR